MPVRYVDHEWNRVREVELVTVVKGNAFLRTEKHCRYLTDYGCAIYNTRPFVCRVYDGRLDRGMSDKCKWGDHESKRDV